MTIILASSSPRRKEILRSIIDEFEIYRPEIEEKPKKGEKPTQYSERISQEKALSIASFIKFKEPFLIISCDTIVTIGDLIIGKPADYDEAFNTLKLLSGKKHQVTSSITLVYSSAEKKIITCSETSHVNFKSLNPKKIEDYLNKIDYLEKAGSYAIQEHGNEIINSFSGSITNIIGLPLNLLFKMFSELGIFNKIF